MGIPNNSVIQYETAIKSGKYVLIAHGSEVETIHAREILKSTIRKFWQNISLNASATRHQ